MSYLNLPAGIPKFNKAVISFWFRVPQESIDRCIAAFKGDSTAFDGVIPLVCLGAAGEVQEVSTLTNSVAACHTFFKFSDSGPVLTETDMGFTPTKAFPGTSTLGESTVTPPTSIGVNVMSDSPTLSIRIQTNMRASINKTAYDLASVAAATTYAGISHPGWPPGPNVDAVYGWTDVPDIAANETEYFSGSDEITVEADKWHHVLWSFSLDDVETRGAAPSSISDNTSSFSLMWLAFDDRHYEQSELSRYWPDGSANPNAVITYRAYQIAQLGPNSGDDLVYNSTDPTNYGVFKANGVPAGTPEFSLTKPVVLNGPVGLPATPAFVDNIYKVELAEFQMWLDVTLDTYYTQKRRAFLAHPPGVEPKDLLDDEGKPVLDPSTAEPQRNSKGKPIIDSETGRPVPDMDTAQPKKDPTGMAPVDPKKAASMMKKSPEILLHMSKNWKIGKNTGSYQDGVTVYDADNPGAEPTRLPGKFEPTGQIKTWKPDPKVGETVGKTVDS